MIQGELQLIAIGIALASKPGRERVLAMPIETFRGQARLLWQAIRQGQEATLAALASHSRTHGPNLPTTPMASVLDAVEKIGAQAKREADMYRLQMAWKLMSEAEFHQWIKTKMLNEA